MPQLRLQHLLVLSGMRLPVLRLRPDAALPEYAHPGDAGCDLRAVEGCELAPGARAAVATGIAVAIPRGWAGLVLPRSGLARRHGIGLVNAPGLVDSGYRGEIEVLLVNHDPAEAFTIAPGDRIAQLVLVPHATAEIVEADALDTTVRGEGGFGSSGRR